MAKGPASIEVQGLDELRRALKELGAEWPVALRKANVEVAKIAQSKSQAAASAYGGVEAKASRAIKASGTQSGAALRIDGGPATPYALGAFFGAKKYPQFPDWVGNSWEPAGEGGPYAINSALRENVDEITEEYGKAIDALTARAFPD